MELRWSRQYQYTYMAFRADDSSASLGADPMQDHGFDLRYKSEGREGPWDVATHYEVLALHGDTVGTRAASAPLALLGAVGYSTASASLRLGRQALSWGNGLLFHRLDFINPF